MRLSFVFVRFVLYMCDSVFYLCDSFCICEIRFVFVRLSFVFVRFVLYLCDSFFICATQFIFVRFVLYLCDSFCICAWQLWATVSTRTVDKTVVGISTLIISIFDIAGFDFI